MTRWSTAGAAIGSVLLVLVLAWACGDDSETAGTPTPAPGTTTAGRTSTPVYGVGVTGTSIKIGNPAYATGPLGPLGIAATRGFDAYIKMVNDAGGVNGRKIDVVRYDSAFDASKELAIAKRLIEEDKVFALVGNNDQTFSPVAGPYIDQMKVPNVGTEGLGVAQYESKYSFATMSPMPVWARPMADFAYKDLGARKMALLWVAVGTLGKAAEKSYTDVFERRGGDVVLSQSYTPGFGGEEAFLANARDKGADVVSGVVDGVTFGKLVAAAKTIDWIPAKGFALIGCQQGITNYLNDPVLNNKLVCTSQAQNSPDKEPPDPGKNEFVDAMKKAFPEVVPEAGMLHGWIAAKLFVDLVKGMGDNITREGLVERLNNLENWDTGFGAKLTFKGRADRVANRGSGILGLKDGKVVQLREWQEDIFYKEPGYLP